MSNIGVDLASKLQAQYEAKYGNSWIMSTAPYQSRFTLYGTCGVLEGPTAMANQCVLVVPEQRCLAFNYAVGDEFVLTPDISDEPNALVSQARDTDTNLSEGTRTNNGEDFVILGVGLVRAANRFRFGTNEVGSPWVPVSGTGVAAVDVALNGGIPLWDYALNLLTPGGMGGPSNPLPVGAFTRPLDYFWEAVLEASSFRLRWGKNRIKEFGRAGIIPPASGGAVQFCNGIPDPMHGFEIPEGELWAQDGPLSQLTAEFSVDRQIVIPLGAVDEDDEFVAQAAYIDAHVILRGLGLRGPEMTAGG